MTSEKPAQSERLQVLCHLLNILPLSGTCSVKKTSITTVDTTGRSVFIAARALFSLETRPPHS